MPSTWGASAVVVAVVAVVACATSSSGSRDGASDTAPVRVPALIDVDIALLPDNAGRVGGLSLRYCPRGKWPRVLAPENRRALPFLVSAVDDDGGALPVDGDGVRTGGRTGCARVVVDVGLLADSVSDRDLALRAGDDLIITPDLWLWRPEPFDDGDRLFVKIADPRVSAGAVGFDALLPWQTVGADGRFVVDASTFALKSDAVFGRFDVETVDAAGARFLVARLDDGRAPAQLSSWLATSANAVAAVTGRFPFARVNVLVVPTHVTRPIVVGFFSRGGGPTATFFVGEGAPDIADDDLEATGRWALTHELSHPLMPPVKLDDAWLNEGLATWHQDLLARRAGLLKDDEAYWRELNRGLATGIARAAEDRLSLREASTGMHEAGAYQHTYWAGVGILLIAEVEARKQGASLDDLVRAARSRFPDDKARSAREILSAIVDGDAHEGPAPQADPALLAQAPTGPQRAAVAARAVLAAFDAYGALPFPPTAAVLVELGVTIDAIGSAHLDDKAPLAAIRRAITQTSTPTTPTRPSASTEPAASAAPVR